MRQANVYCRGILAGVLSKSPINVFHFQYDNEYLKSPRFPPISLSFPKQEIPFESPVLFPFFFGLLSEGDEKAIQCRLLRIDEEDNFTRLLKTCQSETIGGVTIQEIAPA